MLRNWRGRPTVNYYLAWRLVEEMRNEEREIKRDIKLRGFLRKILDPASVNDKEFRKRYGLNKEAFNVLCAELQAKTSLRSSKRVKVEHKVKTCTYLCQTPSANLVMKALPAAIHLRVYLYPTYKILCALSFFRSGSYQRIVGMAKYLGQTTVSKYVEEVTNALNTPEFLNEVIRFPVTRAERDHVKEMFYTKCGIPGVIGCIDGSHFHICTPKQEIEHLFFCRKQFHSLNVQMVCDSECRIMNVNPKYGGPTHDAFIWENSAVNYFMQNLHRNNEQVWLLGDSGYPQRPWLMTPIPDAPEGSPEAKYTAVHGKARSVIENTFGRLKNRWRCVSKHRTLHYKPEKCAKIIIACSVLHNIAIACGVPDPDDEETGDGEEFVRHEVQMDANEARDELFRGRALRNLLVQRINIMHL